MSNLSFLKYLWFLLGQTPPLSEIDVYHPGQICSPRDFEINDKKLDVVHSFNEKTTKSRFVQVNHSQFICLRNCINN